MAASSLSDLYNYKPVKKIGAGAFGSVYEAVDTATGETVAVKALVPGRRSTFTEMYILRSLPPHPSVVGFRRAIEHREESVDIALLVMEYLETDLKKFIHVKRILSESIQIKQIVKQILEGVKFLHENGVVHRDLKPANILMDRSGSRLKICDFGVSLRFKPGSAPGTSLWSTSPSVGTIRYMAPEILLGRKRYSSAVDMWAVGCILGELVLQKPIYQGNARPEQVACIGAPMNWVPFRQKLGDSGFDLLQRLLEQDPEKRITAQDALDHKWFKELLAEN